MAKRIKLIACNTLRSEITHVFKSKSASYPVTWLESQLHNEPTNLANKLQNALDSISGVDIVLLGYGNCGNVVQGLVARDYELIVPRLDDCISLLFGSQARRTEYSSKYKSIFLTEGWMDDGHNILEEYRRCEEKHGEERATEVFSYMYKHYESMTYLETGLYDVWGLEQRTKPMCDKLGLRQLRATATLNYVEQLICGPWPEDRFVRVKPGESVPSRPFLMM